LNKLPNTVVSIDLPSGMGGETMVPAAEQAVVQADHTLAFEWPKLTFMLPENLAALGTVHVLPIGLSEDHGAKPEAEMLEVEEQDARDLMPPRPPAGHKGTFGHALLMAGASGKMGAAVLAARACVRSGAGLVSAYVPAGHAEDALVAVPEAMFIKDPAASELSELPKLGSYSAVGVGPGIGTSEATARLLKMLIQQAPCPLVLDADALNILAENRTWLSFLPAGSILTPHPKEFDRLTDKSTSTYERLIKARDFSRRHGIVLVLKGARTAICSPSGRVFFNSTGNAGMAKGGRGDALTGIITALRAQELDPMSAAILGVYAHGAAGDVAAAELGQDGMLPTDLIERLPMVWKRLRARP
jgi:ADP-dependent NAD(P)H-hydrate dehydratase / NAD(P)H-hydrate epimerase